MEWLSNPNNAYYHTTGQLCVQASGMHALACACIPILWKRHNNRSILQTLADGDGFQYSSSSASNDEYASLYASECTRMRLRTPKISWRSMPSDPPRVNSCRVAMFSTTANEPHPHPHPPLPQMEKVMYGPDLGGGKFLRVERVRA